MVIHDPAQFAKQLASPLRPNDDVADSDEEQLHAAADDPEAEAEPAPHSDENAASITR